MSGRGGRPTRDAGRVLDAAARFRRQKKALEALEQDNFQEEPHADLVMSKKAPKFKESLQPNQPGAPRKKKVKTADYYKSKYRKNMAQLIDEDLAARPNGPNYVTVEAPPSKLPSRNFCNVCGFSANYKCVQCGVKYCQIKCLETHKETRCMKWTA